MGCLSYKVPSSKNFAYFSHVCYMRSVLLTQCEIFVTGLRGIAPHRDVTACKTLFY